MSKTLFNSAELTTLQEAVDFRKRLNYAPSFYKRALQILPWWGEVDNRTSGIFIPLWEGGPGGFEIPNDGLSHWYHYRFSNGFEGMNAGLVRDRFARYPNSPLYVIEQIALEVQEKR